MKSFSAEFKVGIFVLIVLCILSLMTFRVGEFDLFRKDGYVVYAYFSDISGLDKNTKVRIAGVDAGVIEDIRLEKGRARLTLRMFPGVVLYSDAEASINATGLLGDKYLAVRPGSEGEILKSGDTIKNVQDVLSIDDMVRKLSKISESVTRLTDNLNDVIGAEESKEAFRATIKNLRTITKRLKITIRENDKRLRQTLDNIKTLAKSLQGVIDENSPSLKASLANMKDFSEALKSDGPALVKNIKDTSDSLKDISARIERGEGTIGKLVKDEKLYASINNAATGLGKTLSAVERFRTFITFQGEYLTRQKDGKGYFYVTLQPRPEKYYILGIVSDPLGRVTTTTTARTLNGLTVVEEEEKTETKLEFTAQFARRFNNTALRIGITENTFGVGADQFIFHDRLKLTTDVWDFSGDEEEADNPHMKVGAEFLFHKNLYLTAGYDNIFNSARAGAYVGGGLRFEDEDFKYLFGSFSKVPLN